MSEAGLAMSFSRVGMNQMSQARKKIAVFTATGCRACENAVLDIHFQVGSLGRMAEVVFWPYVLGSQLQDLAELDDLDVCFFSGAIRTESDEKAALELRKKSKIMVASGACAAFGGMRGLLGLRAKAETAPASDPAGEAGPPLPAEGAGAVALSGKVEVDYFIPGCPVPQNFLWTAIQSLVGRSLPLSRISFAAARLPEKIAQAVLSGVLPPKETVFAGEKAVCASCSRAKEEKRFELFKRPYEISPDPGRCLLEQGLICQGIATREGCGGLCTGCGVACRGCFGKAPAVYDPGAKMVSAISSTFDSTDASRIEDMADSFVDLAGSFYRYSLPTQCALLSKGAEGKKRAESEEAGCGCKAEPVA